MAEVLVDLGSKATLALVIKSIELVDSWTLVVAAQQKEVLWEFYLVTEEQNDCLYLLLAAVNVVSQE